MQNKYLTHITNEKDLKLYEDYLDNDQIAQDGNNLSCTIEQKPSCMAVKNRNLPYKSNYTSNSMFFQGYLKNHIGKLVKVESLIGGCLETRIGILFEVGANYMVLKLNRSSCSMMIEASSVKYITIIHDNDLNKAALY